MDLSVIMPIFVGIGIVGITIFGMLGLFRAFYVKVPQGTALIVNDMTPDPKVHFTGALVYPVIYKKELMRISLITLEIDRRAKDGLICKDNMRADITVAFYLRVNETREDVLKVAKSLGAERASDREAVGDLFNAKFSEALKTVGKQIDFVKLFEDRIFFREKIVEVIGDDLNGYALEDVAIDYLEQTSKQSLDPDNILDAEGIRKITEITAKSNILTNEFERNEELAMKKKNVETKEAMLALERQQADAEARQLREIATIQAREKAETRKVEEEERQKAQTAYIDTERELAIQEENKQREVEIAAQNRQRTIGIEIEKVKRARDLEIVAREREVELQTIDKEKSIEIEKKDIASIISERIAVERTVAEQEEKIKEVRLISEAERIKQVTIIDAHAAAEEALVKEVKAAEAQETKAKHRAAEINTIAQAELEASSKQAEAEKKLAEGKQATEAASGLAQARVQEAQADALEKEGIAEAKVIEEKMLAKAKGTEQVGLSDAKVVSAHAEAKEKEGLMEAKVLGEKMGAQAKGEEQLGLAAAVASREQGLAIAVAEKEQGLAVAIAEKEQGLAKAQVTREQFTAEADGLVAKFEAMNQMSEQAREHEEFRMRLERKFEEMMASIEASKHIAHDQAEVLASALKEANIDIVGGQGDFFDSFAKSLSVGKFVNGVVGKSPVVQAALDKLMTIGNADNGEDSSQPKGDEKKA